MSTNLASLSQKHLELIDNDETESVLLKGFSGVK